jgi:diphthamide biosynthesis protein 2
MAEGIGDDGSRAMQREVETNFDGSCGLHPSEMVLLSEAEFDLTMDLVRVAEWVSANNFMRVALQFPDGWLPVSLRTVERLRELCDQLQSSDETANSERRLFVLGDTSYGSCCVDHVGAQHNGADCVVHFGPACLAPTDALPVAFVFGRASVDPAAVACAIQSNPEALSTAQNGEEAESMVVMYDLEYEHAADNLLAEISQFAPECQCATVAQRFRTTTPAATTTTPAASQGAVQADASDDNNSPNVTSPTEGHEQIVLGLKVPCDLSMARVLYVGSKSSPRLIQLVLQFPSAQVFVIDPSNATEQSAEYECVAFDSAASKTLRRRFFLTEKARDASIVGVLVGTMGIQGVNTALANIRAKVRTSGRKSYSFLVGKINPHKLANFDEIDVFVLIACPLNSLLDSKDFYKPIVTPYELDVALGLREWNFSVPTDLALLADAHDADALAAAAADGDASNAESDKDAPHFSLATGGMVQSRQYAAADSMTTSEEDAAATQARDPNASALAVPDKRHHIALRYSSPAAELLAKRSWGGLEPSIGETPAAAATLGQTGTASGLTHITAAQDEKEQDAQGISAAGALR